MIIKPWSFQAIGTPAPVLRLSGGVAPVRRRNVSPVRRRNVWQWSRKQPRLLATLLLVWTLCPAGIARAEAISAVPAASNSTTADAVSAALQVVYFETADEHIKINGVADEAEWQQVQPFDNLTVVEPDSLAKPRYRTLTRMFYSPRGLYVSVWNEQPRNERVGRLSARDANLNRDGVELVLDTSGRGLYGYYFGVNLGGTLSDGTVRPERSFSPEWDGPWEGATAEDENGWTAEFFIPWSIVSMPGASDGARQMTFQINRTVAKFGERWGWPALPNSKPRFISALQPLTLEHVAPRQEYSLYPFASSSYDAVRNEVSARIGGDVFWRPSSNFQLSATVNPDFGQVEADDVVVNLTAFETFFPEKRLFFLEGQEVFDNGAGGGGPPPGRRNSFGNNQLLLNSNFSSFSRSLVFTRRMGASVGTRRLTPDLPVGWTANQRDIAQPVDLFGAVKVVGQQGPWRYGLLAAGEDDTSFHATKDGVTRVFNAPGRDYGIARLIYEDTDGGGRRSYGWTTTHVAHPLRTATVHAIDINTLSPSGQWQFDSQLLTSNIETQPAGTQQSDAARGFGGFANIRYVPQRGVSHRLALEYYDTKVDISDYGFLRRNDSRVIVYNFALNESGLANVREQDTFIFVRHDTNADNLITRTGMFLRRGWGFYDNSRLFGTLDYFPEQWDDRTSRGNGPYRIHSKIANSWTYSTDGSKAFSLDFAADLLREDLGDWTYGAGAALNWRPSDRVALQFGLRAARRDGWLVYQTGREMTTFSATELSPRLIVETFISAHQQLKLQLQWVGVRAQEQDFFAVPVRRGRLVPVTKGASEPSDDFTISDTVLQLRYRWELAPLSELFVVYNRGGRLLDAEPDAEFGDLLTDSLAHPFSNLFVMKLRYRLGS